MTTEPTRPPAGPDFPVVGVVSSAGGLDALGRLFGAAPPAPGMAFVLVPHLDPGRDSLMPELIARHTRMPVVEATEGVEVATDHVYLIPPNATMRLTGGSLRLTPPDAAGGATASLDDFLASLAADAGARAVGVVLSGTGGHGTRGLRAVREAGGRTVVQDPATAAFPAMPRAAIDAGLADEVLAPEAISAALARPRRVRPLPYAASVAEVVDVIRRRTGRDFGAYRPGMLTRRAERRAALAGLPGLAAYAAYLADHPDELAALVGDLLIGVTRFFRDPDAYAVLEAEVVPAVLRGKSPGADTRVWVPGCATGEEAYSVAMLFLEQAVGAGRVQVFATDIDADALAVARAGLYPEAALSEAVPPARLDRFFVPEGDGGRRVIRRLRDAVVFAPQNILSDPPFSRLDLICCRNLLIYLEPAPQQRVLAQFAAVLKPGGFLFLGPSESLAGHTELFEPVSGPWRVFRRSGRGSTGPMAVALGASTPGPAPLARTECAPPAARPAELTAQLLLADFAPAAALVDAAGQVEYLSGPTGRFFDLPGGEPTRDLLALVRDGLRGVVRDALAQAANGDSPPHAAAWVSRDDGHHPVRVRVRAVPAHRSPRPYFLIVFDEPDPAAPVPPADALARHLVEELRAAREDLGATAARSQTAGEDMRAANEEMVSVNEELQSAVEELETSKEELQSLNEELTTTNAQLREKGEALAVATADITNLLNSTDLAAVFVCPAGNVRRFTPAATRLFRLIPADVGRPLADLAHAVLDPTIHADIRAVAAGTVPPPEREVVGPDDRWFLRRALPYHTTDGRTDGVILTFADVTPLKRAEVALRRNQELSRLAAVLTDSSDAVLLVEADGRVSAWSRGAERLYGYPEAEAVGTPVAALIPDADRAADLGALDAVRRGEAVGSWETRRVARGGRALDVSVTATLLRPADGAAPAVSLTERDLTARKELEQDLRERSDRTAAILEAAADPIITFAGSGVVESVNRATEQAFGWPAAELVGLGIDTLLASGDRCRLQSYVTTLMETGAEKAGGGNREVVCVRRDGTTFPADLTVGRVDHLDRFVAVIRDTTERKRLEREVLDIAAAEQERIGRELHDSVGQELTGIRLMTEALVGGLRDQGSEELDLAVRVSDGLRDALARVRALSRGLVAAEVDAAGLGPALAALADRVRETTRVGCTFEPTGTPRLPDAAASHLLRIAQEAVTNALRHAGATRIGITLSAGDAATELRVGDDGQGFTTSAESAGGLGLKLMRYRAGRIGAAFRVETGPAGTVVVCSLTAGAADGR